MGPQPSKNAFGCLGLALLLLLPSQQALQLHHFIQIDLHFQGGESVLRVDLPTLPADVEQLVPHLLLLLPSLHAGKVHHSLDHFPQPVDVEVLRLLVLLLGVEVLEILESDEIVEGVEVVLGAVH